MSVEKKVTLIAFDGEEGAKTETPFSINISLLKESATLTNMLADAGGDNVDLPIPLDSITAKVMGQVIQYLEHIAENQTEKVDKSVLKDKELNEWEKKFCDMPFPEMTQLILAANFLDIKHLLDITCKSIADQMRGLTPEQIREKFGIENDFSDSELEEVKKQNSWLEEK